MSNGGNDLAGRAWADIRSHRWGIAVTAIVAAAVGFGLSYAIARRYEAVTAVVPVERRDTASDLPGLLGDLGSLGALAGIDLGSNARNEAIAVLRSRALALSFIESNRLIPILYESRWDAANKRWKRKAPTLGQAYKRFNERVLAVNEDRRSGIVRLSVTWTDPVLASRWANGLVAMANEKMRTRAIGEAQRGIGYLNQEAEKTQVVETREAIFRLMETRINSIMLANERAEYAFRIVDPAIAPEPRDYVWPNRVLCALAALFCALAASVLVVVMRGERRRRAALPPGT